MARPSKKSTRSRAKNQKKTRAPRGLRTTAIKVTKTKATEYRAAKNPDFKVRMVRHGSKPAEYFVDVIHRKDQAVRLEHVKDRWGLYIAKTTPLKNGEVREIVLPYNGKKIETIVREADKNPETINQLKEQGDLFGFTVEGNRSRSTFRTIERLRDMLNYYVSTGSKGAKISIFRVKREKDWRTDILPPGALKRVRAKKEPRRQKPIPENMIAAHEAKRRAAELSKYRRYYEKHQAKLIEYARQRRANLRKKKSARLRPRKNRR